MASMVSRPIPNASTTEDCRSSVASNMIHMYYNNNITNPLVYEIIDPESSEEMSPRKESFAMSASIENALRDFDLLGVKILPMSNVRDYLYCFSDMVVLLRYVVDLVRAHFDYSIQLSMEMYHDFETRDEYLTLYVRQYQYDSDIMKTIKKIRRKYRGLAAETEGKFLLTTDFRPPR